MASGRTYVPGLRIATKAIQIFIGRYREKLENSLGTSGLALLDTLLNAVTAMLDYIADNSDSLGNFTKP